MTRNNYQSHSKFLYRDELADYFLKTDFRIFPKYFQFLPVGIHQQMRRMSRQPQA
ncbi:hypothetical protein MITS9504_01268 [Synechococcus sp. MIT S9504]|nr:hypothetical protein MITS9504_01268 [Synechococcus sp. MIT S9504]